MTSKVENVLSPRESGDYIARHSDHVAILEDGIKATARMVSGPNCFCECHKYLPTYCLFPPKKLAT